MTDRRTDPVEVLCRGTDPTRFLWQDRLYVVRALLGHQADRETEVWQVEAAAGRCAPLGVYELTLDARHGTWTLARTREQGRQACDRPPAGAGALT
jgi:hypothetical protein